MLIELVFSPVILLLEFVIGLLPDMTVSGMDMGPLLAALEGAFAVFPYDLFILIVGNAVFWLEVQFAWAVVEWIYKKIPGVD